MIKYFGERAVERRSPKIDCPADEKPRKLDFIDESSMIYLL